MRNSKTYRKLYESIMMDVAKLVKKKLNEDFQSVTAARDRLADDLKWLFRNKKTEMSDCRVDTQRVYNNDIDIRLSRRSIGYVRLYEKERLIRYKFRFDVEEYPEYKKMYDSIAKAVERYASGIGWTATKTKNIT